MVLALIVTLAGFGSFAVQRPAPNALPVRSTNPGIARIIAEGTARSGTFKELTQAILANQGIVYVEQGSCAHGVRSCLIAVSATATHRVIQIRVQPRALDDALIATVGHELRHAVEVLSDPTIVSTVTMQRFYRRVGRLEPGGAYETDAALLAGDTVRAELRRAPR